MMKFGARSKYGEHFVIENVFLAVLYIVAHVLEVVNLDFTYN